MTGNLLYIASIFIFLLCIYKQKDLLRVDSRFVILICSSLFAVSIAKAIILALISPEVIYFAVLRSPISLDMSQYFMVWWEDVFFVLPYLWVYRVWGKKAWPIIPLFILSTLLFGLGHLYQGSIGWVAVVYPALSFLGGKKYGLGTMMIIHVAYDVSISFSIVSGYALVSYLYG